MLTQLQTLADAALLKLLLRIIASTCALRCILDSPLNKAGMVGAIYVKMDQRGVFEVKPHVRIPRTCNRFCGVISKLSYHFLLPFFLFYFQLLFVV
ncbi:hypothetical protein GLYMA_09G120101v4 [Glycine max]|nr:hypothetical protein GLYMA_09G120101v4 [Glycine max]